MNNVYFSSFSCIAAHKYTHSTPLSKPYCKFIAKRSNFNLEWKNCIDFH